MYEAIIVGAGFSGLGAAHALLSAGCDNFLVLEARDRVGGRTKPGKLAGLDIDLGGMWLSPTQTRLKHFADHYGIDVYPTFLDGDAVYRIGGREHRGPREKIDGLFKLGEGIDYFLSSRKLDRLGASLNCEAPWDHPRAAELDAMTVEHWLALNVRSERMRSLYRLLCFSLFCAEASQISMLFFLHYVKSGDGIERIISADQGGGQNFLFKGSLHQIARRMGDDLGDRLRLAEPVSTIKWATGSVQVDTATGNYEGRRVILALPPTLVPSLQFHPQLPQAKAALHKRLNMGSAIKFWVAYDTPFWREQGLNGLILRDDTPATPVMDVSPPDQPLGVLAGFFDGNHALVHGDLDSGARRDIVVNMLAEHFGERARDELEYVDIDWTAEDYSEGCYGAFAPPGLYADFGPLLREPIGPLHWAGTETSPRWTGYVDGAIRSGERAAAEVLARV